MPFLPFPETLDSRWYLGVFFFLSALNSWFVRYVSLHSTRVSDCLDGQLTTALVATVPSLCFLVQSTAIAKVRETFWRLICPYALSDWRVVVGG